MTCAQHNINMLLKLRRILVVFRDLTVVKRTQFFWRRSQFRRGVWRGVEREAWAKWRRRNGWMLETGGAMKGWAGKATARQLSSTAMPHCRRWRQLRHERGGMRGAERTQFL